MKKLFLLLLIAASVWAAPVTWLATIDASGLSANGYLNLQFSSFSAPPPAGTVVAGNFSAAGLTLGLASSILTGSVTPNAAYSEFTFDNSDVGDLMIPFTVGAWPGSITFMFTIDGDILTPPPGASGGADFGVFMWGADTVTPLLTADGALARVSVADTGVITTEAFAPASLSEVPEPATLGLGLAGALALWFARRRAA